MIRDKLWPLSIDCIRSRDVIFCYIAYLILKWFHPSPEVISSDSIRFVFRYNKDTFCTVPENRRNTVVSSDDDKSIRMTEDIECRFSSIDQRKHGRRSYLTINVFDKIEGNCFCCILAYRRRYNSIADS